jgi:hypothetical protein
MVKMAKTKTSFTLWKHQNILMKCLIREQPIHMNNSTSKCINPIAMAFYSVWFRQEEQLQTVIQQNIETTTTTCKQTHTQQQEIAKTAQRIVTKYIFIIFSLLFDFIGFSTDNDKKYIIY